MKYAVVYRSLTGNTRILAEKIQKEKGKEDCVYFGEPDDKAKEAEVLYVGFWTDKGSCDDKIQEFLQNIHGKKIYMFGTAGFGKEESYFERILANVISCIPEDNQIGKGFMCQGKMPVSVRKRYEAMLEENPQDERMKMMIENFDQALSHPDEKDMQKLKEWIQKA